VERIARLRFALENREGTMKSCSLLFIACAAALAGTAAFAQTPPQPEAAQPAPPAPAAPQSPAPAPVASPPAAPAPAPEQSTRGRPANICQELVAFLTPKPAPAPAAAGAPAGTAAPAPAAAAPAAKPPIVDLAQVQPLAESNDIKACRDVAQKMRMAGMALPAGLIALAGLRLEDLEQAPRP
jgi:hypothetical protein